MSSGRLFKNVILTVEPDGTLSGIEENVPDMDARPGVEYYNGLLIPGTVNCHCHLEYSYVKGMIPPGGGLPEFIRRIIEIKYGGGTSREEMERAAGLWDDVMYKEGVVAVGDVSNYGYTFDTKQRSRIDYHTFVELLDVENEPAQESFRNGLKRLKEAESRGLKATLVPHANYSMCDELLGLAGGEIVSEDGVRADGLVSVHFKESVEMGGPEETRRTLGGVSASRPVLLVHCIYATEEDVDAALAKFGKGMTMVSCPCSNRYIEDRIGDVDLFARKGIRIALGTDSLSSNTQLSLVEEIKCMQEARPGLPLAEIVRWATLNGAEALGIADWAGSFETGKRPGVVLLDRVDFNRMRLTPATRGKRLA